MRGISRLVIGSKPTHLAPAFSQDEHAGRFWSQRFFRNRQRLQAETLRKDDAAARLRDGSAEGGDDPVAIRVDSSAGVVSRARFFPDDFMYGEERDEGDVDDFIIMKAK